MAPWMTVTNLHHKLIFLLDSDYGNTKCKRLVENLLKRKKGWLFRFVTDPDVESTNKRDEKALRSSEVYRKISGGSRSEKGAEIYTRTYSIYYTSKLRGKNFITDTSGVVWNSAKAEGQVR